MKMVRAADTFELKCKCYSCNKEDVSIIINGPDSCYQCGNEIWLCKNCAEKLKYQISKEINKKKGAVKPLY